VVELEMAKTVVLCSAICDALFGTVLRLFFVNNKLVMFKYIYMRQVI
jgi:hypothetical protein